MQPERASPGLASLAPVLPEQVPDRQRDSVPPLVLEPLAWPEPELLERPALLEPGSPELGHRTDCRHLELGLVALPELLESQEREPPRQRDHLLGPEPERLVQESLELDHRTGFQLLEPESQGPEQQAWLVPDRRTGSWRREPEPLVLPELGLQEPALPRRDRRLPEPQVQSLEPVALGPRQADRRLAALEWHLEQQAWSQLAAVLEPSRFPGCRSRRMDHSLDVAKERPEPVPESLALLPLEHRSRQGRRKDRWRRELECQELGRRREQCRLVLVLAEVWQVLGHQKDRSPQEQPELQGLALQRPEPELAEQVSPELLVPSQELESPEHRMDRLLPERREPVLPGLAWPEQLQTDRLLPGPLAWLAFRRLVLLAWLGQERQMDQQRLEPPELPEPAWPEPRQTDRRLVPGRLVVRAGLPGRHQMDQQPQGQLGSRRHQTDRQPEPLNQPEQQEHCVRCRQELHGLVMEPCGASRLHFPERFHNAAAWRHFAFGTARRAPWSDTSRGPSECSLGRVRDSGQRGRSRWCRWLRGRHPFQSQPWLRVRGRVS